MDRWGPALAHGGPWLGLMDPRYPFASSMWFDHGYTSLRLGRRPRIGPLLSCLFVKFNKHPRRWPGALSWCSELVL